MQPQVTVVDTAALAGAVALPVGPDPDGAGAVLLSTDLDLPDELATEVAQFLADVDHRGTAGALSVLPRPTREPAQVLLVGAGDGGARAWRDAGAAVLRASAERHAALTVALPADPDGLAAGELALGLWLAAYRSPMAAGSGRRDKDPALRRVTLVTRSAPTATAAVERARTIAAAVSLARDLTNTPSAQKSPKWFSDRVAEATSRRAGQTLTVGRASASRPATGARSGSKLTCTVFDEVALADAGFGGLLAVGSGSARPPRLVELSWRPRGARTHVVLVGKGICFDTGGISIKPLDGMKLMRKDMGAAAAVCATVLAAADLNLPVRVTALAPLAENLVSGSSMRPGDVVRHYGGITTEVLDTDAEGRLVLGDALAYAAKRLKPDYLIDLATLTGASHVALGKQTAALFSDNADLAQSLRTAGAEAGEPVWPLPLPDDYVGLMRSEVADLANISQQSGAGAVTAALFLRELAGDHRDRWAHIDMSAPAWSDRDSGPLVKGATGWGVRMLVRFLARL